MRKVNSTFQASTTITFFVEAEQRLIDALHDYAAVVLGLKAPDAAFLRTMQVKASHCSNFFGNATT